MRDFTSESAAPEGMWVQCGGIELPRNLIQSVCFQEVQAQYHEKCNTGPRNTICLFLFCVAPC